jgi:hypothetical protein
MNKKHQIETFSDELLTGKYHISLGVVRHQIRVGANPINTWVSSHTGRDIIINENIYPYNIPNGIFTKTGKQHISLGVVRHQIRVGANPINTWVSSHTGRDIIINENIYPHYIPNGIFTKTISENFKQLS